jgi:hypothetical protein
MSGCWKQATVAGYGDDRPGDYDAPGAVLCAVAGCRSGTSGEPTEVLSVAGGE